MPNKEGRWVTINGRAIFIAEGQSLEEAMNSKGQVKAKGGPASSSGSQGSSPSKAYTQAKSLLDDPKLKIPHTEEQLKAIPEGKLRSLGQALGRIKDGLPRFSDAEYAESLIRPKSPGNDYFESPFFHSIRDKDFKEAQGLISKLGIGLDEGDMDLIFQAPEKDFGTIIGSLRRAESMPRYENEEIYGRFGPKLQLLRKRAKRK